MGLDITGFGSAFDLVKTAISFIPNPNQKEKDAAASALAQLEGDMQVLTAQIEVNKIEAASPNIFVAGWRPFLCWACSAVFILVPLSEWVAHIFGRSINFPDSYYQAIIAVLLPLAGLRSFEKYAKIPDSRPLGNKKS